MAGAALTLNFDKLGAALSSNSMAVEQVPDMVANYGWRTGSHAGQSAERTVESVIILKRGKKSLSNPISVGTEVRKWLVIPIRS